MKSKSGNKIIGIDLGSVSVKTVVLDEDKNILNRHYKRHRGHPGLILVDILEEILKVYPEDTISGVGLTGSGGKRFAPVIGGVFINEVIAEARAVSSLFPDVKTIINIGGQDSKLIQISTDKEKNTFVIDNFSMNTLCAAGTGAFLDQQAHRLGISIENEFGELALKSEKPPRIAGRCSVFAKSDMIHLQQRATPIHDIVAGLCYAVARNYKATIGRNVKFQPKAAFIGGVAKNTGMVAAFKDILGFDDSNLIIPEDNELIGAIGSALNVMDNNVMGFNGLPAIKTYLLNIKDTDKGYEPLTIKESLISNALEIPTLEKNEKVEGFLGVDVGSISTNIVVIDKNKNILAKKYLRTDGAPIEAVKRGFKSIGEDFFESVKIIGACTTGSARYLIGDFIGADHVKNEITAHARGAIEIDKTVDTIFEIGGQDSKYISISDGVIVDFEMNKVCAAGTGSFLEEQAERLDVNIEEEFSDMAFEADTPCRYGERCTVFMESDLVNHQQKGATKDNIVAGLSYAIVYNYLNKVVESRKIGDNIFFQGGVAFNSGVVAAFEKVTGKKIIVPPHHEVMGAIGSALIAYDDYMEKNPNCSLEDETEILSKPCVEETGVI